MKPITRTAAIALAAGGLLALGGCVGVPGPAYSDGYYNSSYQGAYQGGYSGAYVDPAPVYVQPAPVYIEGGYSSGPRWWGNNRWNYGPQPGYERGYNRGYDRGYGRNDGRGYDRDSGYRPGYAPRPGVNVPAPGPRPGYAAPAVVPVPRPGYAAPPVARQPAQPATTMPYANGYDPTRTPYGGAQRPGNVPQDTRYIRPFRQENGGGS